MDIVEAGTALPAGTYFFTPAESIGMSPLSTLSQTALFRPADDKDSAADLRSVILQCI